jgi:hypothetical protein
LDISNYNLAFEGFVEGISDELTKIVRAHYLIDKILDELLMSSLPNSDHLDLHRISFILKTDFAIALGRLNPKIRPLYNEINSIRNRFAHDPFSKYSDSDAIKSKNIVKSCLPDLIIDKWMQADAPGENLNWFLEACFVLAESSLEHSRKSNIALKATMQYARERVPKASPNAPTLLELDRRIETAIKEATIKRIKSE